MLTSSSSQEVVLGESFLSGASKAEATSAIAPTDGAPSVGSTPASATTGASALISSIAMTSSVSATAGHWQRLQRHQPQRLQRPMAVGTTVGMAALSGEQSLRHQQQCLRLLQRCR